MEQIVLLNTIIVGRGTVVSQISNPNPCPSVKSKRKLAELLIGLNMNPNILF